MICTKHDVTYSESCWCCDKEKAAETPESIQEKLEATVADCRVKLDRKKEAIESLGRTVHAEYDVIEEELAAAVKAAEDHRATMPNPRSDLHELLETVAAKVSEKPAPVAPAPVAPAPEAPAPEAPAPEAPAPEAPAPATE